MSAGGDGRAALSTEQLALLLHSRGLNTDRSPALVYTVATQFRHAIGPLLLSLWEQAGADLGPVFGRLLEMQRERERWCREVFERIRECVEGVHVVKGLSIADRYPPGWVRPFGDLDLCARDQESLFGAWDLLVAAGFTVESITVTCRGDHPSWTVRLNDPGPMRFDDLLRSVELSSAPLFGSAVAIPPRDVDPAPGTDEADLTVLRDLLAILEEGFQRPYSTRDVLDVIVCYLALSSHAQDALREVAGRNGLLPELYRVARMLDDWTPYGVRMPGAGRRALAAALVGRWTAGPGRGALRSATVRRWLQRRALPVNNRPAPPGTLARAGRLGTAIDRAAGRALRPDRATHWRDGLLFFGFPVVEEPLGAEAWGLEPVEAPRFAETPSGRFLLTVGTDVDEREFEEARRR